VIDETLDGALLTENAAKICDIGDFVDRDFLVAFLTSEWGQSQIRALTVGSTQPKLALYRIKQIAVPLPPLPEQRAIASVLGALDDKIDLNRRMCQTLEEMARALFKSWFVDFDPVRAKMEGRDPGLPKEIADLFPSRLVDSELGPIPEGWRVVSLSDLVEVSKGASYTSAELQPSSIALLSLKSFVRGGGYRDGGLKPFVGRYKESQVVACGDVVMPCTDVTQAAELIGRTARVPQIDEYETIVASTDVLVLRPSVDSVPRNWLALLGRSPKFVAAMLAHSTGTTVLHLAREAIPKFLTAVPPTTLLASFDDHVSPLIRRSDICQNQNRTLASLRDTLLPKLISGELRVPASLGSMQEVAS
jgi:type I restriction enzyme S subunit